MAELVPFVLLWARRGVGSCAVCFESISKPRLSLQVMFFIRNPELLSAVLAGAGAAASEQELSRGWLELHFPKGFIWLLLCLSGCLHKAGAGFAPKTCMWGCLVQVPALYVSTQNRAHVVIRAVWVPGLIP